VTRPEAVEIARRVVASDLGLDDAARMRVRQVGRICGVAMRETVPIGPGAALREAIVGDLPPDLANAICTAQVPRDDRGGCRAGADAAGGLSDAVARRVADWGVVDEATVCTLPFDRPIAHVIIGGAGRELWIDLDARRVVADRIRPISGVVALWPIAIAFLPWAALAAYGALRVLLGALSS